MDINGGAIAGAAPPEHHQIPSINKCGSAASLCRPWFPQRFSHFACGWHCQGEFTGPILCLRRADTAVKHCRERPPHLAVSDTVVPSLVLNIIHFPTRYVCYFGLSIVCKYVSCFFFFFFFLITMWPGVPQSHGGIKGGAAMSLEF